MFSMRACVNHFYKDETHNMGRKGDRFELVVILRYFAASKDE